MDPLEKNDCLNMPFNVKKKILRKDLRMQSSTLPTLWLDPPIATEPSDKCSQSSCSLSYSTPVSDCVSNTSVYFLFRCEKLYSNISSSEAS